MKVFLSYGHDANTDLVLRIKRDLEAAGHLAGNTSEIKHTDNWRRKEVRTALNWRARARRRCSTGRSPNRWR